MLTLSELATLAELPVHRLRRDGQSGALIVYCLGPRARRVAYRDAWRYIHGLGASRSRLRQLSSIAPAWQGERRLLTSKPSKLSTIAEYLNVSAEHVRLLVRSGALRRVNRFRRSSAWLIYWDPILIEMLHSSRLLRIALAAPRDEQTDRGLRDQQQGLILPAILDSELQILLNYSRSDYFRRKRRGEFRHLELVPQFPNSRTLYSRHLVTNWIASGQTPKDSVLARLSAK